MKSNFMIALAESPEGLPARIHELHAAEPERGRLEAMGLCAGRIVDVVKSGDPMIVRVLGARIGLAASLARLIRVGAERAE